MTSGIGRLEDIAHLVNTIERQARAAFSERDAARQLAETWSAVATDNAILAGKLACELRVALRLLGREPCSDPPSRIDQEAMSAMARWAILLGGADGGAG